MYKCSVCGGSWDNKCNCKTTDPRDKWVVVCDRLGCGKPAYGKGVYAMGYIASVCQEHYDQASQQDKNDAIRFRYAE